MMANSAMQHLQGLPWIEFWLLVAAGILLSLLYFGSLWVTTGKLLHSRHPLRWLLCSLLLRLSLLLPAFYWIGQARWQNMLVCLAGFLVGRVLILRLSAVWQFRRGRLSASRITHVGIMPVNLEGMQQEHFRAP